jgi:uncharacterized protein (UPF0297 family)
MDNNSTTFFKKHDKEPEHQVKETLEKVYAALSEKGYNPTYQIVGYILSGDPTYITSYQNARTMIGKLERDELLEAIVNSYIRTELEQN